MGERQTWTLTLSTLDHEEIIHMEFTQDLIHMHKPHEFAIFKSKMKCFEHIQGLSVQNNCYRRFSLYHQNIETIGRQFGDQCKLHGSSFDCDLGHQHHKKPDLVSLDQKQA